MRLARRGSSVATSGPIYVVGIGTCGWTLTIVVHAAFSGGWLQIRTLNSYRSEVVKLVVRAFYEAYILNKV